MVRIPYHLIFYSNHANF